MHLTTGTTAALANAVAGPHALACAARLPGCVAVLTGASLAPWNAPGLEFLSNAGKESEHFVPFRSSAMTN